MVSFPENNLRWLCFDSRIQAQDTKSLFDISTYLFGVDGREGEGFSRFRKRTSFIG